MDMGMQHSITSIPLPIVSELEQKLSPIIGKGPQFTLDINGHPFTAKLRAQDQQQDQQQQFLSYTLDCLLDGQPIGVNIDGVIMRALLSTIAPNIPLEGIPEKLRLAIIQAALVPLIRPLSKIFDVTLSIVQVRYVDVNKKYQPHVTDHHVQLLFQCFYSDDPCRASLSLTNASYALFERMMAHATPTPPSTASRNISVEYSIHLPGLLLNIDQIATLDVHDILLLDTTKKQSTQIWAGDYLIGYGQLQDSAFTITQLNTGSHMETQPTSQSPDPEQITNFDHLPVNVTFEVARKTMTLVELNALSAGQVLELGKPLDSPITVHVNGQTFAKAELVNINDRLGARITQILLTEAKENELTA